MTFLNGRQTPTVECLGLDHQANKLAVARRGDTPHPHLQCRVPVESRNVDEAQLRVIAEFLTVLGSP